MNNSNFSPPPAPQQPNPHSTNPYPTSQPLYPVQSKPVATVYDGFYEYEEEYNWSAEQAKKREANKWQLNDAIITNMINFITILVPLIVINTNWMDASTILNFGATRGKAVVAVIFIGIALAYNLFFMVFTGILKCQAQTPSEKTGIGGESYQNEPERCATRFIRRKTYFYWHVIPYAIIGIVACITSGIAASAMSTAMEEISDAAADGAASALYGCFIFTTIAFCLSIPFILISHRAGNFFMHIYAFQAVIVGGILLIVGAVVLWAFGSSRTGHHSENDCSCFDCGDEDGGGCCCVGPCLMDCFGEDETRKRVMKKRKCRVKLEPGQSPPDKFEVVRANPVTMGGSNGEYMQMV